MDTELLKMCDTPEIQDRWEPKVGDRVCSYRLNTDGIVTMENKPREYKEDKDIIYIPRIEDVASWMTRFEKWAMNYDLIMRYIYINRWYDDNEPVMAFIRAYMHLEHNKTWNGEAWE